MAIKTTKNILIRDNVLLGLTIGAATIVPAITAALSGNTWLSCAIAVAIPVAIATLPVGKGMAK